MGINKKVFGYVRVSSQGQLEGSGLDRQEEAVRDYAQKAGFEVVALFKEKGVSGTTDESDRPAFQEMVAEILRNGVDTVIVEGLDRLAREYRIQETLLIYLASKGITLLNARTEEDVTAAMMSDPMKKALIQIQGVFSELEKNLLVKKLRLARERKKAETGKCEGRKSYAEIAPEVIQELRKLHRKPKGRKRLSCKRIAEAMNEKGLKTATGKSFTGNNVAVILHRI